MINYWYEFIIYIIINHTTKRLLTVIGLLKLSMESSTKIAATFIERKQGCLLGLFAGDAMAMPVHWYYSLGQLKRDYG